MKPTLLSLLCTALLLGGCTLSSKDNAPFIREDGDTVRAFGKLGADTADAKAGGWVMLGEKYTYVLDKSSSEHLSAVFDAGLKRPYETVFFKAGKPAETIQLDIWRGKRRFYGAGTLCLSYPHADKDEADILRKLSFSPAGKTNAPTQCLYLYGKIHTARPVPSGSATLQIPVRLEIHSANSSKTLRVDTPALTVPLQPATPPLHTLPRHPQPE